MELKRRKLRTPYDVLRIFWSWVKDGNQIGEKGNSGYGTTPTYQARQAVMSITLVVLSLLFAGIGTLLIIFLLPVGILWFSIPTLWALGDVLRRVFHNAFRAV